jgi:hypothetical protein
MLSGVIVPARGGATLVELLVTTTVGGIALTLVATICLREQRVFGDMREQAASSAQLRDAEAILPIDLRAASSVGGDIREARDTSIEMRGIVASAVVCDTTSGGVVLAPATTASDAFASTTSAIASGDTAWVLSTTDSTEDWRPFRVSSASAYAAGQCGVLGPQLSVLARGATRSLVFLDSLKSSALGAPVRVTRPFRYSLYRGTDGSWYLGQRDWNTATARFNSIQPVSGPFLPPVAGGLSFRYFDSVGAALATPVANMRAITSIRVLLRGETKSATRALASAAQQGPRVDSAALWILLRNRR